MVGRAIQVGALVLLAACIAGCGHRSSSEEPSDAVQSNPNAELAVTVREKCRSSFDQESEAASHHDAVTAGLEERNVYRIKAYDNGEDRAELVLVSHETNLSPQGGGSYKAPGMSSSWKYEKNSTQSPLTGVEISFNKGWLQLSVPNNPCCLVKATEGMPVAQDFAHDFHGSEELAKQLRHKFAPNTKRLTATGHATFKATPAAGVEEWREVDYTVVVRDAAQR